MSQLKCRNIPRGPLLFRVCNYLGSGDFTVQGYNTATGALVADFNISEGTMKLSHVVRAYVMPSKLRQGIGTQAYEIAVAEACSQRRKLSSDEVRSPYAEAFWRKQAKKGRAVCLTKREQGASAWWGSDATLTPSLPRPKVIQGRQDRWPCFWWGVRPEVVCAPGGGSLAGLRGRCR
jgi:hypothetical protein